MGYKRAGGWASLGISAGDETLVVCVRVGLAKCAVWSGRNVRRFLDTLVTEVCRAGIQSRLTVVDTRVNVDGVDGR